MTGAELAGSGAAVVVALAAFETIRKLAVKKNDNGKLGKAVEIITEKDGDGIPLVYTPRADMRRMTESLKAIEEQGVTGNSILEKIHTDLTRNG